MYPFICTAFLRVCCWVSVVKKVLTAVKHQNLQLNSKGIAEKEKNRSIYSISASVLHDWMTKCKRRKANTNMEVTRKRHERKCAHLQLRYIQFITVTSVLSAAGQASCHLAKIQLAMPSTSTEMCSCFPLPCLQKRRGKGILAQVVKVSQICFWIQTDMDLLAVKILVLISCSFLSES